MCGINGFFNYAGVSRPINTSLIESMNRRIAHRGPDDSGVWCNEDKKVYLGHQRLSILDLSAAGHQPMKSLLGNVIVFNGEIYNYPLLKKQFKEVRFFSQTDTEVLLHLYEEHGHVLLEKLNGMFAFALWDRQKEELFLARDRVGIKPLYYTLQSGIFAFSSEIKSLLELPWVEARLDEEALYHFLTYNKLTPPYTMFDGIHKVKPGHFLVVSKDGVIKYEPYWDVSLTNLDNTDEESIREHLLHELRMSVNRRMLSDVEVGAFISGGVDSSAIVALMREFHSGPIKTYSIGFKDAPAYDELSIAKRISQKYGTQHFETVVGPEDIRELLPRVVDIFDEPLADATAIPIYFLSKQAKEEGSKVVLTGDGSDEIFCGYRAWTRYARLYPYYRAYNHMPPPLKKLVAHIYGAVDDTTPAYEILQRAAKGQEFFWGGAGGFKESTKRRFLSSDYKAQMRSMTSYEPMLKYRRSFDLLYENGRKKTDVDWMCFLGVKNLVPNFYMYRADRLGMSQSIELRVPFLDHHLVNFALSIPGRMKVARNEPKSVLKSALEPILPIDILYRKKMGFCVPLREWAGDIMLGYLDTHLAAFCSDTGLFNEQALTHYVTLAKQGNTHVTPTLWNMYFLMTCMQRWFN